MTDLIIIGAGPGGYETAVEAAKRGITVTLINDGPLGGVFFIGRFCGKKCIYIRT